MKIPDRIKIGGHVYKVRWPYEFTERSDAYGSHIPDRNEIRISDRDSMGNERDFENQTITFIHEIFHAIERVTGHKVFKDGVNGEPDDLIGFSECVFQILVDNGYWDFRKDK